MKVPREATGHDGVYVLGCLDRRVTIYSQQVRALNLAAALFDDRRLVAGDEVLVIGAGAAGLTCAAGLDRLGAKVTVLEQANGILSIFAGKPKRWVHPGIYEWPFEDALRDDAGLPLLNWRAGMVEDVEAQMRAGWSTTGLSVKLGVRNIAIGPERVTWNPGLGRMSAKVVVLAVGFGLESSEYQGDRSYWESDDLDDVRIGDRKTTWLLSGCGDGALTDLFRLCIRDFRHDTMVRRFTSHPETRQIVRAIEQIEANVTLQRNPSKLHDAYADLEAPWLDAEIVLRTDTQVSLNAQGTNFLTTGASVLNRFITAQLVWRDAFHFLPGRIGPSDVRRVGEAFEVTIAGEVHPFDRIVRRHGPLRALEKGFPTVWTALDSQRRARQAMPITMDHSRNRLWPAGLFAVKSDDTVDPPGGRLAHVLDRVAYWNPVRDACDLPTGNYYFMIDGAFHQGVGYLLGRILDSFNRQGKVVNDVVEVFTQLDLQRTVVAEDWARHLAHALGTTNVGDALAARKRPLLLLLRAPHAPLQARRDDPGVGLDEPAIAGLCDFLTTLLPKYVADAKPTQPIRVLVPIEYPMTRDRDRLATRVREAIRSVPGFTYIVTGPLGWPHIEEVWTSLADEFPDRVSQALYRDVEAEHARIERTSKSFDELAVQLPHVLAHHGLEA